MSQVTGTMPFDLTAGPGLDTGASNDIVRSNDQVTYAIQFNVNDDQSGSSTAGNVTISQTLPAGMSWVSLPPVCRTSGVVPPSTIVGQTLTCNVGDIPTGSARTLNAVARVNETTNGTVLTPAADSITVTADGATPDSVTPAPVTVSSIPRVDMVKNSGAPTVSIVASGGSGNVPGYNVSYPVSVRIPDFGGRGLIGYSPPDPAMTFTDNYAGVSPNAEFVSCGAGSRGSWTCNQGAGQTTDIAVNVTDPTTHSGGVLSNSTIVIFVPKSDVDAAGSLNTTNTLTNLDATGSGGTVPAEGENLANNSYSFQLSSSASGSFLKHYVDVTAPGRYVPGGPNVDRSGAAVVNPGEIFQGEVRLGSTNPIAGYNSIAACDVFDTVTQEATTEGAAAASNGGQPAWVTANSVTGGPALVRGTDFVIEYATQATSTDPNEATRWAALRATDCGGSAADWSTTPPADPADITKVRARLLTTPPNQFTLAFAVNLKAKPGVDGTKLANFMPVQTDGDPDTGAWADPSYNPDHHSGSRGDRLLLTVATTRLTKDIIDPAVGPSTTPTVLGGTYVQYRLNPRVLPPNQGPGSSTARDVKVYDILPAGTTLNTDPGREPSVTPTSTVVNGDGTTTLTWDLGDLTSDDTPGLTYWVRVSNATAGNKVNRAIVTSPDDVGSMNPAAIPNTSNDPRFAARTINVAVLAGIQVDKSVREQVVEPGDEITFDVTYANLFTSPVQAPQTIDVLPFNGDGAAQGPVPGRNTPSDFHGSYTLEDVTVNNGETVEFTDADPVAVYASQNQTAAGAATYGQLPPGKSWCTAAQITAGDPGCPTAVATATAIRVTSANTMAGLTDRTFSYRLKTSGNRSGDEYANTAALRSPSITLGTLSPTRNARVVANRIGDYVWDDLNRNGRQDAGEPPVPGVRVALEGTNKRGEPVRLTTTTDSDGKYMFTGQDQGDQDAGGFLSLVSGSYRAIFDPASLPARASFTTLDAAGVPGDENSKANSAGATALITLPDPRASGVDGENLTLDAGIVIAAAPPPAQPPATTPPAPTTRKPKPKRARLDVSKVADRKTARAGSLVKYRIKVRNRGNATARNLRVCDKLPSQLTVRSRSKGARFSQNGLCWRMTLKAGQSRTVTVTTRIDRDARSTRRMRNVVKVTGGGSNVLGERSAAAGVRVKAVPQQRAVSPVTG